MNVARNCDAVGNSVSVPQPGVALTCTSAREYPGFVLRALGLGTVVVALSAGCAGRSEEMPPHEPDASVSNADSGTMEPPSEDGGAADGGTADGGLTRACSDAGAGITCSSDAGASFARTQEVLDRLCVTCHKPGAKLFGGILLTADVSHAELVGVRSNCNADLLRVKPGVPEQSLLWLKVANRACGCGRFSSMPPGFDGLRALPEDFCAIENWIRAGAPAN